MRDCALWRAVLALSIVATACGGAEPWALRTVPAGRAERERAIADAGARLHGALVRGAPRALLVDDVALRILVDSSSATRYAALRVGVGARLEGTSFDMFGGTRYSGVCLQGARLEPAGGAVGLVAGAWVFDRALVAGELGGRRVAAWVEGTFVFTNRGFVALDLTRVESPRWEHADLELAPCDMEGGIR